MGIQRLKCMDGLPKSEMSPACLNASGRDSDDTAGYRRAPLPRNLYLLGWGCSMSRG